MAVFDSELVKQHEFVAEIWGENKDTICMRDSMHLICTKNKAKVMNRTHSAVKFFIFSLFDMEPASRLLTCL